jgi:hypothetical protein
MIHDGVCGEGWGPAAGVILRIDMPPHLERDEMFWLGMRKVVVSCCLSLKFFLVSNKERKA